MFKSDAPKYIFENILLHCRNGLSAKELTKMHLGSLFGIIRNSVKHDK